jgi:hypothetical protein
VAEHAKLDYRLLAFQENFHSISAKIDEIPSLPPSSAFIARERAPHAAVSEKINHDGHISACAFASANLDSIGHGTKRRNNTAFLHHRLPRRSHPFVVEHGSNISDAPFSIRTSNHGGLTGKPSIRRSLTHQSFRVRRRSFHLFGPHGCLPAAPIAENRNVFLQRITLLQATAKRVYD